MIDQQIQAANDGTFALGWPDLGPDFNRWAYRVAMRMVNPSIGDGEERIERAILAEGTPSPEWAAGLSQLLRMAKSCE